MKLFLSVLTVIVVGSLSAELSCDPGLNRSTRINPNESAFQGFADLIVWTAREPAADCWAEVITGTNSAFNLDMREVDFGWDVGFRAGCGYAMARDQWDTQVYYTWFATVGKGAISDLQGTIHSSFVGNFYVSNPKGKGLSGPSYQQAEIDWKIDYNIVDWDLGRSFWVSQSLALRPFAGLKGGWIDQEIDSKWKNPSFTGSDFDHPQLFSVGKERVKNQFWGIGPSIGLDTKWNVFKGKCHFINLLGDLSGAIMWGHWSFDDLYTNDARQTIVIGSDDINGGATMIRLFMGLGWDIHFDQHLFSTKIGFESQFWMDQLQYYSFVGGRLTNQLTLQGGTFEISLNY